MIHRCDRCNRYIGSLDPPHSCIYDERDALLKRVADLETENSSLKESFKKLEDDFYDLQMGYT